MIKRFLVFVFFTSWSFVNGQDTHFTQLENALVMINPALTGNFNGYAKATTHYRNQWLGSNSSFQTSYGMAEMNFGKKKRGLNSFVGIGTYFVNDIAGLSRLGTRTGGISASGNVPISRNQWFSGGMNISFNQRTIDLSNVTFLSQWDGSGLNSAVNSGENTGFNKDFYTDVGLGIAFNFDQTTDQAFNAKDYKLVAGVSFQHLNQPQMNFVSIDKDRLYLKSIFHIKYEVGLSSMNILELSGAQFFQGPHRETILGIVLKNKLKENSHFTSLVSSQFFSIGAMYRSSSDICPYISMDLGPLSIGVAYDYNIRTKTSPVYKHSFELQLAYLFSKSKTLKF